MSELIDREDADYDLEKLQADAIIRGNRQYSHGIRDARKVIAGEPKVDSVVHGQWNSMPKFFGFTETDELYGEVFKCSNCGETIVGQWNFCPYCGACMDEVK